jgi:predicted MPP superfamily phosphohydrolase
MPLSRIEEIVEVTNRLEPDLVVLLGDFVAGMARFRTALVSPEAWGRALSRLEAPLGVRAVLGNHDWWTDVAVVRDALTVNRIPVMENDVELISPDGHPGFWLAGLGDQLANRVGHRRFEGVDDVPGTLAKVRDNRPIVMLAHEPDIFATVPDRVWLTLSGHTHGGQVNLPIAGRVVVPSAYGDRYAYGHVAEKGRNLIVSGGLGCSVLPIRFGVPPEIVIVELG